MFSSSFCARLYSLFVVLPFLGCGGGPSDMPDIGQVTGTITVDGQPAGDLMVTFQPKAGRPSYATTDAAGAYELQYNSDAKGAKIGPNQVTISTASDGGDDYSEGGDSGGVDPIPAKYNTLASTNSEMTVEVKSGSNEFNWDVKSK